MLEDKRVDRLKRIIKDSFRIRPNHNPKYIDVEGHLDRLGSKQQQVIFGRRGSGKSCLLVHYKNDIGKSSKILSIYISTDEIKRLGYPDVLIRLLLQIMENLPSSKQKWRKFLFQETTVQKHIKDLRKLLNQAEKRKVQQEDKQETKIEKTIVTNLSGVEAGKKLKIKRFKVDKKEGSVYHFKQGTYDSQTGIAKYTKKELPFVLNKMTHLHKATTNDPLYWLNLFFGTALLFFVVSAFWMFLPSSQVFKKGLYFTLGGIILTLIMLFI